MGLFSFSLGDTGKLVKDVFDAARGKDPELDKKIIEAQNAVNAAEANHASLFVSGWRPFVGWTCGLAFAYNFLAYPFLTFAAVNFQLQPPPLLDVATMLPVLLGMLGLAGARSVEKLSSAARN